MSLEHRRTETVFAVIKELFAGGKTQLRPGDVNTVLRERGAPLGTWEVRAEFTTLEGLNRIECDAATGAWHLTEGSSLEDSPAKTGS